jgi:hypothetical protein
MKSKSTLVIVLLGVSLAVQPNPGRAATPAGGLVHLRDPIRVADSRTGPPSTGPFGVSSIGLVSLFDAQTSGSATIYPCGGTPGSDPSLVFDAGEVVYARFASPTPQCIVSSVPMHAVADSTGFVTTVPESTDCSM